MCCWGSYAVLLKWNKKADNGWGIQMFNGTGTSFELFCSCNAVARLECAQSYCRRKTGRSGVALLYCLRVCPETSGGIAKFSEHEADRGEAQECERFAIEVLPILGESAAAVEPREGALDDPAFGQYDKSFGLI